MDSQVPIELLPALARAWPSGGAGGSISSAMRGATGTRCRLMYGDESIMLTFTPGETKWLDRVSSTR